MAAPEHNAIHTQEHRLLLSCVRTTLDERNLPRVQELLERDIDWEHLLRDAFKHRVALLLDRTLRRVAGAHPTDPYRQRLREHARTFSARNLFLVRELTRLLSIFDAEEIAVVPYKGPVIAHLAYRDIRLREFNDLDLLVRPQDLTRICNILRREGVETKERLTSREQAHVEKEFKEYCFQSGLVVVEPHWSITAHRFPFPIDYDALWMRSRSVLIEDATVRVFSPEDLLLIQCVTGGKSLWKRLELVCDVAETVRAFPEIDWSMLLVGARASGSERMLLLGLDLARRLLDAPLPEEIIARFEIDPQLHRLSRTLIGALFAPQQMADDTRSLPRRFSPLLMSMRERPVHRWLYLWRTLTTPTLTHLRRFPLPGWLWPIYRFIVPAHDYVARPIASVCSNFRNNARWLSRTR